MKIAILAPIHWRTPPEKYGPWELISGYITEGLVKKGHEVTLYATGDSITKAKLRWICPRPVMMDSSLDPKVYQYLHTALVFEEAGQFDIIHNHYDAYPLAFSKLVKTPIVTTLHGFSSQTEKIYEKYNHNYLISISFAEREQAPQLKYFANVYHGIPVEEFPYNDQPEDYFCYLGRISLSKGVDFAINLALKMKFKLVLAGLVDKADEDFFNNFVKPKLGKDIRYLGNLGKEKLEVYKKARAMLHFNFRYPEPFGMTLIESLACGTPVIGMKLGSVPEVIKDKETGFVLADISEAENAIRKINTIKRTACRERAEKFFSVEKMVDEYEKVYFRVLEERATSNQIKVPPTKL